MGRGQRARAAVRGQRPRAAAEGSGRRGGRRKMLTSLAEESTLVQPAREAAALARADAKLALE